MGRLNTCVVVIALAACGGSTIAPTGAPAEPREVESERVVTATSALTAWIRPGWFRNAMHFRGEDGGTRFYAVGMVRVAVRANESVAFANSFGGDLRHDSPLAAERVGGGWLFASNRRFAFAERFLGPLTHFPELDGGYLVTAGSAFIYSPQHHVVYEVAEGELQQTPFPFVVAVATDQERTVALLPTSAFVRVHGEDRWNELTLPETPRALCHRDDEVTLAIGTNGYVVDWDAQLVPGTPCPSQHELYRTRHPSPEEHEEQMRVRRRTQTDAEIAWVATRGRGVRDLTPDGTELRTTETGLELAPWRRPPIAIPNSLGCLWSSQLNAPFHFLISCRRAAVARVRSGGRSVELTRVPIEQSLLHVVDSERWVVRQDFTTREFSWFRRTTGVGVAVEIPVNGVVKFGGETAVFYRESYPRETRVARWGETTWSEPIPFSRQAKSRVVSADGTIWAAVWTGHVELDLWKHSIKHLEMWRDDSFRQVSVPPGVYLVRWMSDGSIVTVGESTDEIWRSVDLGESWTRLPSDPRAPATIAVLPRLHRRPDMRLRSSSCPWARCVISQNVVVGVDPPLALTDPVIVGRAQPSADYSGPIALRATEEEVEAPSTRRGSYIGLDAEGVYRGRVDVRASDRDLEVVAHARTAALLARRVEGRRRELLHARAGRRPCRLSGRQAQTLLLPDGRGMGLEGQGGHVVRGFVWDENGRVSEEREFAAVRPEPVYLNGAFYAFLRDENSGTDGALVPLGSDGPAVPFRADIEGYCRGPVGDSRWRHRFPDQRSWEVLPPRGVESRALASAQSHHAILENGENGWCVRRRVDEHRDQDLVVDQSGRLRSLVATRVPQTAFAVRAGSEEPRLQVMVAAFLDAEPGNRTVRCVTARHIELRPTVELSRGWASVRRGGLPTPSCLSTWANRLLRFAEESGIDDERHEQLIELELSAEQREPGAYVTATAPLLLPR